MKESINYEISWSSTKFSKLTSWELYAESKENDLLALGSKRVSSIHLLVGGVIMLN